MGVETIEVEAPFETPLTLVDAVKPPAGGVEGDGPVYVLSPSSNASVSAVNRLLEAGARVSRVSDAEVPGIASGSFLVQDVPRETVDKVTTEAHAAVRAVGRDVLSLDRQEIRAPRIGLYRSYRPNAMDEGWTRFILQEYDFDFETVRNADIRQGDLSSRFDVIVLPQQSARDILDGNPAQDYPTEFAGGIGEIGAAKLRQFVDRGGTLIAFDSACELAIKYLYLPITNVLEGVRSEEFYNPGSLMRLILDPQHPIAYGYDREAAGMFVNSPAFDVDREGNGTQTVARYPLSNQLLAGWMLGGDHIKGRAALVESHVGRGRVILFGFRPQFRAQARGTYRLLFNALYWSTVESQ